MICDKDLKTFAGRNWKFVRISCLTFWSEIGGSLIRANEDGSICLLKKTKNYEEENFYDEEVNGGKFRRE
jgi:hypothetical protein